MFSDDVSGSVVNGAVSVSTAAAQTGIEVFTEIAKAPFKILGKSAELLIRLSLAKKERELHERASGLYKVDTGKVKYNELIKSGQEPCFYGDFLKDELKNFSKIATRWGISYSYLSDRTTGNIRLVGLPSQAEKMAGALKEFQESLTREKLIDAGFTNKDIDDTFYAQYGQKGKIFEDNNYNGKSQENFVAFKNKNENSILWESISQKLNINYKQNEELSKKENFITSLEDSIEETMGLDNIESNYVLIPDKGVVYINASKNENGIDEYRTVNVRFLDGHTEQSLPLSEEELKETRAAIYNENQKLHAVEQRISRYGDLSPAQKNIVQRMWYGDYDYSTNTHIDYSEKFNISEVVKPQYSPQKLAALFSCMQDMYNMPQEQIDKNMEVLLSDNFSAEQITCLKRFALSNEDISLIADKELSTESMERLCDAVKEENNILSDTKNIVSELDEHIKKDIASISEDLEIRRELSGEKYTYALREKNNDGIFVESTIPIGKEKIDDIFKERTSELFKKQKFDKAETDVVLPTGERCRLIRRADETFDIVVNDKIIAESVRRNMLGRRVFSSVVQKNLNSLRYDGKNSMNIYGYTVTKNNDTSYTVSKKVNGKQTLLATVPKNQVYSEIEKNRNQSFEKIMKSNIGREKEITEKLMSKEQPSRIEKIIQLIKSGNYTKAEMLMNNFFESASSAIPYRNERHAAEPEQVQIKQVEQEQQHSDVHGEQSVYNEQSEIISKADELNELIEYKGNLEYVCGDTELNNASSNDITKEGFRICNEDIGHSSESYTSYLDTVAEYNFTSGKRKGENRFSPLNTALIKKQLPQGTTYISAAQAVNVPENARKVVLSFPVSYGKKAEEALKDVKNNGKESIGAYSFIIKENGNTDIYKQIDESKREVLIENATDEQFVAKMKEVNITNETVSFKTHYGYAVNQTGKAEFELTADERAKLELQIKEYKKTCIGTANERTSDAVSYLMNKRYGVEVDVIQPPKNLSINDLKRIHTDFSKQAKTFDKMLNITRSKSKTISRAITPTKNVAR